MGLKDPAQGGKVRGLVMYWKRWLNPWERDCKVWDVLPYIPVPTSILCYIWHMVRFGPICWKVVPFRGSLCHIGEACHGGHTYPLFYTPIQPLAYQYLIYTAAIGAGKGSLPTIHQRRFSHLMELSVDSNLPDGTFSSDGTQRDVRIWSSKKGRGFYIANNKNSIPGRILLLKVNVYIILVI